IAPSRARFAPKVTPSPAPNAASAKTTRMGAAQIKVAKAAASATPSRRSARGCGAEMAFDVLMGSPLLARLPLAPTDFFKNARRFGLVATQSVQRDVFLLELAQRREPRRGRNFRTYRVFDVQRRQEGLRRVADEVFEQLDRLVTAL